MSAMGRPTQDKRDKRFTIRLSDSTYQSLEKCAKTLNISKADVVHKGIELVEKEIKKQTP